MSSLLGKPVATVTVKASDSARAIQLARELTDQALDVLRFSIGKVRPASVPDQQLLFQRGRRAWSSPFEQTEEWGSSGALGFRPVPLRLIGEFRVDVDAALRGFSADGTDRLSASMVRAAQWIVVSTRLESPDLKVIALCAAGESFLTLSNDRMKGENLVLRALLLCLAMEKTLPGPGILLDLYVKRSKVVHGSALAVCGQQEYRWLRQLVTHLLGLAGELASTGGIRTATAFIERLESPDALAALRETIAESMLDSPQLVAPLTDLLDTKLSARSTH